MHRLARCGGHLRADRGSAATSTAPAASAMHAPAAGDRPRPVLQGVKVVELATVIAAPAAAAVLADFGADVIKVESPGGDMWRGQGAAFANSNRARSKKKKYSLF